MIILSVHLISIAHYMVVRSLSIPTRAEAICSSQKSRVWDYVSISCSPAAPLSQFERRVLGTLSDIFISYLSLPTCLAHTVLQQNSKTDFKIFPNISFMEIKCHYFIFTSSTPNVYCYT